MIEKEKRKGERMEYKNCEECNKEIPLLQLGELCGGCMSNYVDGLNCEGLTVVRL